MTTRAYALNPRQWWPDVETLYKARLNSFLALAARHIYNKDHSIDVVQDAMVKTVEYFNKNPDRKIREQIVRWQILKAVKRANKYSREVPWGLFREEANEEA